MKALLIIDMQQGSFIPYDIRHDAHGTIARINQLAQVFRDRGFPVIFVQHDGTRENNFLPGSPEWQLLPELSLGEKDFHVSKTANDSFYRSNLQEVLQSEEVTELFVTGCATDFCVDATIKSAVAKDYRVTVVADGHTTASRPEMDAVSVIDFFNRTWTEMIPTRQPITVSKTSQIIIR